MQQSFSINEPDRIFEVYVRHTCSWGHQVPEWQQLPHPPPSFYQFQEKGDAFQKRGVLSRKGGVLSRKRVLSLEQRVCFMEQGLLNAQGCDQRHYSLFSIDVLKIYIIDKLTVLNTVLLRNAKIQHFVVKISIPR